MNYLVKRRIDKDIVANLASVGVELRRFDAPDLIALKQHGITSLVLKYRTNANSGNGRVYPWKEYLPAVEADARQAIRILRSNAEEYGLKPNKIGICGFSAGGNLAILERCDGIRDYLILVTRRLLGHHQKPLRA